MATKYHFNKDTGRTGKCEAKIKCRLGLAESEHFGTREEAQKAFEKTQDDLAPLSKNATKTKKEITLQGVEVDLSNMSKDEQLQLQDKWNNRYKLLNDVENGLKKEPEQPSPEDLLAESVDVIRARGVFVQSVSELLDNSPSYVYLDGVSDDSDYVVVVSARQGGGNRECYCGDYDDYHEDGCLALNNEVVETHPNYVTDYDDDFDSTYNYFVFDNGITEAQFNEFKQKEAAFNDFSSLKNERDLVKNGKAPAWFVNDIAAYRKNSSDFEQLDRMYKNTLKNLKNDKEKIDSMKSLVNQVENGNVSDLDVRELNNITGFAHSYSVYDLNDLKEAFQYKQKAESFRKMYKEAEELADGSELKKYLLGDRGTGTYNSTEKIGRRKVTVKKTYQRGSILGKELEDKERLEKRGKDTIKRFIEPLEAQIDAYDEKLNKVSEIREARENARKQVWETGWSYSSSVPHMHKDFLKNDE